MEIKKVAVLFGGKSPEHEVSVDSAQTICGLLVSDGIEPVPVYISRAGIWYHVPAERFIREKNTEGTVIEPNFENKCFRAASGELIKPQVCFPIVHGTTGEDGVLQGLLELLEIPYVGAGVTASAVGMDKIISKILAERAGIPVLPQVLVREYDRKRAAEKAEEADALGYPLFVKPAAQGSSVGVTKVKTKADILPAVEKAFRFDNNVIIEKGVDMAREIVCAVLGTPSEAEACLPGEVAPQGKHEFYDYESKYTDENGMKLFIPAPVGADISGKVREWSVKIFLALGISGFARADFLMDRKTGEVWFCEVNTLPGFTSHSLYPKLWAKAGTAPREIIMRLLRAAAERREQRSRLSIVK